METFITNVSVDISYSSVKPQGFDYESHSSKTRVKYQMDMELREWGIKDLSFSAPRQTLAMDIELLAKDQEDSEEFSMEIDLETINVEGPDSLKGLCPGEIEIEIKSITKVGNIFKATGVGTLKF